MKKIVLLIIANIILAGYSLNAQIAINSDGSAPESSAMLDVKSTSKGLLLPRMTTTQIGAISSPADHLMVFNTTDSKVYIFSSADNQWKALDYGAERIDPLICGSPLVDIRDGQSYATVLIGTQCWMAENLNVGTYINYNWTKQTDNGIIEKYAYNGSYGGYYLWAEMVQYLNGASWNHNWDPVPTGNVQGICPDGWHLPWDEEWKTMEVFLGMSQSDANADGWRGTDEGGKLKRTGTTFWNAPNTGATNSSGFSALGAGYNDNFQDKTFYKSKEETYWFTITSSAYYANYRHIVYNKSTVYRANGTKQYAYSVRCLKD
jgi:uncharacterized protein (TIGR02145 family)